MAEELELVEPTGDVTKDDILEALETEEEEPVKEKEVVKEKEEEEKKDEEEPEIEIDENEDEEEPDEKKQEELELVVPPRRKEILTKYPKLFKDFPYLERAMYKEKQYTEILPTIEDAKVAAQKATTLDKFEADLSQGKIVPILKAIKETDEESFKHVVDNYLFVLEEVDEKAYNHVLGNVIKNTVITMVDEAKRSNNKELMESAALLNQFIFGTSEFTPPKKLATTKEPDSADARLKKEREAFVKERFDTSKNDLDTKVQNTLKSTVDAHIDPNGVMSDYVKRTAIRDALESLDTEIGSDTRFSAIMDGLWKKAFETNFNKIALDKIRAAYLSKAKTLLPNIIKKSRTEALKGMGRTSPSIEKKGHLPVGKTSGSKKIVEPKEIPKKMSTLDYLMSED